MHFYFESSIWKKGSPLRSISLSRSKLCNIKRGKLTNIRVLDGLRGIAIFLVILGRIELIHKYILGIKILTLVFRSKTFTNHGTRLGGS